MSGMLFWTQCTVVVVANVLNACKKSPNFSALFKDKLVSFCGHWCRLKTKTNKRLHVGKNKKNVTG